AFPIWQRESYPRIVERNRQPSGRACGRAKRSSSAICFFSPFYPQHSFLKRHAMFAVLPLHVPVSRFLEGEGREPCCYRQLAQPTINRNIDSIRRRISDDEAYDRIPGGSPAK